jgi:lysophospholipase L1-like esterase
MLQIHCFGDSITYGQNDNLNGGWCNMLKLALQNYNFKTTGMYSLVYNNGIPGAKISNLKKSCHFKISEALLGEPLITKMITILSFGANDCRLVDLNRSEFATTKKDFGNELTNTCNYLKGINSSILIQNITPILEPVHWGDYQDLNRKNTSIEEYNQLIKQICLQNQVELIDTYSLFQDNKKQFLSEDGLHPSSQGHNQIFNSVKELVLELIKEM